MPEYLTCEDKSRQAAEHVVEWLTEPAKRTARIAQLAELRVRVGNGGASKTAADYMLREFERYAARSAPRTHFPFATRLEEAARGAA
jgi:hypothetical protein